LRLLDTPLGRRARPRHHPRGDGGRADLALLVGERLHGPHVGRPGRARGVQRRPAVLLVCGERAGTEAGAVGGLGLGTWGASAAVQRLAKPQNRPSSTVPKGLYRTGAVSIKKAQAL